MSVSLLLQAHTVLKVLGCGCCNCGVHSTLKHGRVMKISTIEIWTDQVVCSFRFRIKNKMAPFERLQVVCSSYLRVLEA